MEEILQQIVNKKAIPIGSDVCCGCQNSVPVHGCAFIPLHTPVEKDGVIYENLAVFICKDCASNINVDQILCSLRRMFMEFDVSVI